MELRILRYIMAIVETGSFNKAAKELNITQPTLSRQIKDFEEFYNIKLFDRKDSKHFITDDGYMIYQKAKEIINLSSKLEDSMIQNSANISGVISIGAVESSASDYFFNHLSGFAQKYPEIQYEIYNSYSDDIKSRLDNGILDLGILTEPVELKKYNFEKLPQKDKWILMVSKQNKLAQKDEVNWSELTDQKLLIPKRFSHSNELKLLFENIPENIQVLGNYTLFSNAVKLVENNLACAPCFESVFNKVKSNNLVKVPLIPSLKTGSVIAWKRNTSLTKPVRLLLDYIQNF